LFIRPLNAGPLSGWTVNLPKDIQKYRTGLEAETEYEFQLEGWNEGGLKQVSNKVLWSTADRNSVASFAQLTPNPIERGGEVQFTWTDSYEGKFELEWIDMTGKKYPIGDRRKIRDTYLEVLSCRRLPAGQYFLHLIYSGKTITLPLIVY
jgi:hypothetical protein